MRSVPKHHSDFGFVTILTHMMLDNELMREASYPVLMKLTSQ